MTLQITINSVDYTEFILHDSIRMTQALTKEIDKASFLITAELADISAISPGQEIVIGDAQDSFIVDELGNNLVDELGNFIVGETVSRSFAGIVTDMDKKVDSVDRVTMKIKALDYQAQMDQRLVPDTFSGQTVDAIITSLRDNFFPTFTLNNVNAPITLGSIAFNYEKPSKCLQQLADAIGYDWYVDYDKDVHFFLKGAELATVELNDTNGSYNQNTLRIHEDNKSLKNSIVVRGGVYDGATANENTYTATGTEDQNIVPLSRQYSNLTVSVNSVPQTVGIENIDINNPSIDVFYEFSQKYIRFKNALSVSDTVDIGGNPKIPVIIQSEDEDSITDNGRYDFIIVDKNISTQDEARQRAVAELNSYRALLNTGSFVSLTAGWRAGQTVTVDSAQLGVSGTFLVTRVDTEFHDTTRLRYTVTIADTRAIDNMIDFFIRLLKNQSKNIDIKEGEVVDLVRGVVDAMSVADVAVLNDKESESESATVADSETVQALDYATDFVYSPFAPTGLKRSAVYDGSVYG